MHTPYPNRPFKRHCLDLCHLSFVYNPPSSLQVCTVVNEQGSVIEGSVDSIVVTGDGIASNVLFVVGD
jgi:butyrate kinase